jgi:hypothetical protein
VTASISKSLVGGRRKTGRPSNLVWPQDRSAQQSCLCPLVLQLYKQKKSKLWIVLDWSYHPMHLLLRPVFCTFARSVPKKAPTVSVFALNEYAGRFMTHSRPESLVCPTVITAPGFHSTFGLMLRGIRGITASKESPDDTKMKHEIPRDNNHETHRVSFNLAFASAAFGE